MPLRWTDNGAVIGRENEETGVEEFLGIPFASVKRFQRAEKYEEWEEPLVCSYSSYSYPQAALSQLLFELKTNPCRKIGQLILRLNFTRD